MDELAHGRPSKLSPARPAWFVVLAVTLFVAAAVGIAMFADRPTARAASTSGKPNPVEGRAPALSGATGWLNSEPLTPAGLRGKVVLFDFWTFTCINWQRTAPYVRAWAARYRDHGLVVVGVHSPEFAFERDATNVTREAKAMHIDYPIAIDSDFEVWRAFRNQYWPALYIVDAQGRVRHHHFGEGGFDEAERVIQQLLDEAGARDVPRDLVIVDARGSEVAADWDHLRSPETYIGVAQARGFASPGGARAGRSNGYASPSRLALNAWALDGRWTVRDDAARLDAPGGKVTMRFHARDLHLVMGPTSMDKPVRFRVRLDGRAPGDAHGADVDAEGNGIATTQRLHQLIRQTTTIEDRRFEIEFFDPGVEAFVFTFG